MRATVLAGIWGTAARLAWYPVAASRREAWARGKQGSRESVCARMAAARGKAGYPRMSCRDQGGMKGQLQGNSKTAGKQGRSEHGCFLWHATKQRAAEGAGRSRAVAMGGCNEQAVGATVHVVGQACTLMPCLHMHAQDAMLAYASTQMPSLYMHAP